MSGDRHRERERKDGYGTSKRRSAIWHNLCVCEEREMEHRDQEAERQRATERKGPFRKTLGASILHKYCGAVHWKHSCMRESGHVCLDKGENVHACANFECTCVCVRAR